MSRTLRRLTNIVVNENRRPPLIDRRLDDSHVTSTSNLVIHQLSWEEAEGTVWSYNTLQTQIHLLLTSTAFKVNVLHYNKYISIPLPSKQLTEL